MSECKNERKDIIKGWVDFCIPHHKLAYECEIASLKVKLKLAENVAEAAWDARAVRFGQGCDPTKKLIKALAAWKQGRGERGE